MLSTDAKSPSNTGTLNPGSKQYKDLKSTFDYFDKNNSGRINASELGTIMKNIGKGSSDGEIADMMSSIDKDSDGYLGFDEFVIIMGGKSKFPVNVEDELKEQFRLFDLNGDGVVSMDELKTVLAGMGEMMTEADINELVGKWDLNNDGVIDYQEFVQAMMDA